MELRKDTIYKSDSEDMKQIVTSINSKLKEIKEEPKKNIHSGHRERLKMQFIKNGLDSMTDIQKLELLLFFAIPQKDTNPVAHNLLLKFGSFKNVIEADYSMLIQTPGIKENSATLISLVNAFANYYHKSSNSCFINSSGAAIKYVSALFHGVTVEQFYIICISKNNEVLKCELVSTGLIDEVNVQIRDLTKIAIENKVNRIIIAHNHPQGLAEMSDEDYDFTYNLLCSCILNSIEILDHIIIGTDGAFSIYESGVLELAKKIVFKRLKVPQQKVNFLSSLSKEYTKSKIAKTNFKIAE